MITDAHLHIDTGSRLKLHPEIVRVFLNATALSDFDTVKAASSERTALFFGFHPWMIPESPELDPLEKVLKQDPAAGIGECGLDFSSKYRHNRKQQLILFENQLRLAYEYRRALSIHCVHAWGQLFDSLQGFLPLPAPFIIHSFYGSSETADRIVKCGGYLSLSDNSFRNPEKSYKIIEGLPMEKLLVESDLYAGGAGFSPEEHYNQLSVNYRRLASIKNISEQKLADEVNENGKIFTD